MNQIGFNDQFKSQFTQIMNTIRTERKLGASTYELSIQFYNPNTVKDVCRCLHHLGYRTEFNETTHPKLIIYWN